MKAWVPILVAAVSLAACSETPLPLGSTQGPPPSYFPPSSAVFSPQDFAWSTGAGSGSISGVLTFRAEGVRYGCAGGDVILTPETPWSRRRITILYGSPMAADVPVSVVRARESSGPKDDYARYVKKATCNEDNHFRFTGLPAGAWFVITLAKPIDAPGEPVAIMRRIEIRGGSKFVTLS
jgi:hypothetical protein